MKLTLNKALKLKNKLSSNLATLANRIQKNNSYKVSNKPTYDSRQALEEYKKESNKIVALKSAINTANVGITGAMLELAEKKSLITILKATATTSGMHNNNIYSSSTEVEYVANITELERDKMIESLQKEIEDLQDKIDYFNVTTEIEVNI